MDKPEDVETLPLESVNPLVNLMVRDVATVQRGVRPGEIDRDMSQRYLTLTANVEGEDMGRASRQVAQAIAAAGEPPRGVRVEPMGQLPPMIEMFESLGIGLAVAVFVIFVLLTAYFQSPRLALISIGAVPGVLAGIAAILYFTNTSLNIESFMGSIMSPGRLGVELGHARDVHGRTLEGRSDLDRGGHRRRGRAAAADPDDRLRDDRRHGADGAGPGARQPDAGPAGPGGDRRAGDVDVRHLAGGALDLRGRDRPEAWPARRRSTRTTAKARTTTRTSSSTSFAPEDPTPEVRRPRWHGPPTAAAADKMRCPYLCGRSSTRRRRPTWSRITRSTICIALGFRGRSRERLLLGYPDSPQPGFDNDNQRRLHINGGPSMHLPHWRFLMSFEPFRAQTRRWRLLACLVGCTRRAGL